MTGGAGGVEGRNEDYLFRLGRENMVSEAACRAPLSCVL